MTVLEMAVPRTAFSNSFQMERPEINQMGKKPSFIRTLPSAPEFHRIVHTRVLAGCTAGRELGVKLRFPHPAPKVMDRFLRTVVIIQPGGQMVNNG